MIPVQRDARKVQAALLDWLKERKPAASGLSLSLPAPFGLGNSGELLACAAQWSEGGSLHRKEYVVRLEPTSHQLFLDPNFYPQYRALEAFGRSGILPVPPVVGFEDDTSLLGARFYVMEKISGRPGVHTEPWMRELDRSGNEATWWSGLETMAKLHRLDWKALDLQLLESRYAGATPTDRQLNYYAAYYEWVRNGVTYSEIERAARWLRKNMPDIAEICISWGDARRPNQLFNENLTCCGILDFEQACLGHAEWDLAWWIVTETKAEGLSGRRNPGRDETLRRYSEMLGRPLRNLEYFEVFAAYRAAILTIQLRQLGHSRPWPEHWLADVLPPNAVADERQ